MSQAVAVLVSATMMGVTQPAFASDFAWQLPVGMTPPPVPSNNAMSSEKVELGRRLFFDIRLSGPGYMACATCHKPKLAFTDGRRVAIGVTGQRHTRNTPSLANVAYLSRLGWAQPQAEPLEVQLRRPMFGEDPVEMGTRGHEVPVLAHIRSNRVYRQLFQSAFPQEATVTNDAISFATIGRAIAAFQRTIVSGRSSYDSFMTGNRSAMPIEARRGFDLFKSARLNCSTCHVPPFFTDAAGSRASFHNTGLYNADGSGRLPGTDQGLANETQNPEDIGRFRTPTLRNIAVTAPYMHDGSVATLDDVIDHYAAGGRAAQQGMPSPLRSPLIKGFSLSAAERRNLIAFLHALTDRAFLAEPRYNTPYR